jgi:hypothetical protein
MRADIDDAIRRVQDAALGIGDDLTGLGDNVTLADVASATTTRVRLTRRQTAVLYAEAQQTVRWDEPFAFLYVNGPQPRIHGRTVVIDDPPTNPELEGLKRIAELRLSNPLGRQLLVADMVREGDLSGA